MMNIKKLFINFVLLISLAGCATTYKSEVVRFHDLAIPSGAKVTVQPGEGMENGPEFRQYADMVISKLSKEGFVPAGDEAPDLTVLVSYGVLRQETHSHSFYWRSSYYFGHPFSYYPYSYYYPYYYGYYWDYPNGFYHPPKSERMLEVIIKKPDETVVFEGRVVSVGNISQLVKVMPYMVEALFTDFPGESGAVSHISISEEDLLAAQ